MKRERAMLKTTLADKFRQGGLNKKYVTMKEIPPPEDRYRVQFDKKINVDERQRVKGEGTPPGPTDLRIIPALARGGHQTFKLGQPARAVLDASATLRLLIG